MQNNIEFYVKYGENQPVVINTHINNDRTAYRTFPIMTVAHLLAAYFPSTPPNELAQYTLHSISDGVETIYNSWDPLNVLGENGKIGINPLIIKSNARGKCFVLDILNFRYTSEKN